MIDNQKFQVAIEHLNNKTNTIYFFLPPYVERLYSVYEIYNHAQIMLKAGYQVALLTDVENYEHPNWFESSITDGLTVHFVGDKKSSKKVKINSHDVLVIPEANTNVMKVFQNIYCLKITLLLSFDAGIGSLAGGLSYNELGIRNVLTTNPELAKMASTYLGKGLDIKTYKVAVPEYFKPSAKPKKPYVTFFTRNANDITKVVKMFYNKYPKMKALTFESLHESHREEFARKLSESCAVVWLDRIASFGTLPLEAMACGTVVAGLVPEIDNPYIDDNNGLWVFNTQDIPDAIARAVQFHLMDEMPEELTQGMAATVAQYSKANSEKEIIAGYEHFLNAHLMNLQKFIPNVVEQE